LTMLKRSISQN